LVSQSWSKCWWPL